MSAVDRFDLARELAARRSGAQAAAHRRVGWLLRLTSLWTPLAIFGLLFLPYVVLIQLAPGSAGWAQPLLQALGLALVLATLLLAVARLGVPRFGRLRAARVEAAELLSELSRELARHGDAARQALLPPAMELDRLWLERESGPIEEGASRLADLADKKLPGWRRRAAVSGLWGLALTLLAVGLLRTLVVEPFRIPSGSMLPTLQIGDHVVVNRFIYGVRIPWMNKVPFVIVRRPRAGDVIVFENPLDSTRDFIKRVIAVPGDRVEIKDEIVYINGQPQPRQKLVDDFTVDDYDERQGRWFEAHGTLYEEQLGGVRHATLQRFNHPNRRYYPFTVPEGQVFVMGDNRDNSLDSRFGFGVSGELAFVPYGNIKGKAMVVWLSLGKGGWPGSLFGGSGVRLRRLFEPVR